MTCFKCDRKGHLSTVCKSSKKKVQGVQEAENGDVEKDAKVNVIYEIVEEFDADCFQLSVADAETMFSQGPADEAPFVLSPLGETAAVVAGFEAKPKVPHYVCDTLGCWRPGRVEPSARVNLLTGRRK